jgi:hypothetical protein
MQPRSGIEIATETATGIVDAMTAAMTPIVEEIVL